MNYWKSLIQCAPCSKRLGKQVNFNTRVDRGSTYFICSRKKNFNDCIEPMLKEKVLLEVITKHLELQGKEFLIEKLKLFVHLVKVEHGTTTIMYRDGTTSRISDTELIF